MSRADTTVKVVEGDGTRPGVGGQRTAPGLTDPALRHAPPAAALFATLGVGFLAYELAGAQQQSSSSVVDRSGRDVGTPVGAAGD